MPNPYAVPASPTLGPIYIKQGREHYAYEVGETCLLTDRVFQDKSSQQQLQSELPPLQPPNVSPTDSVYANPLPSQVSPVFKIAIREHRKMIKEHVETRIPSFLQQLIFWHQANLYFESVCAQDRGKSADVVMVNIQGHHVQQAVRQAAHSSGNPCILAFDNTQSQMYQAGLTGLPFCSCELTDYS